MAARLLRSWVQIPQGAWIFVCCECRVLSGRGLCDELITRPKESYRLRCVVVCNLETSRMGPPYIYIYIYDISRLRVNVTHSSLPLSCYQPKCEEKETEFCSRKLYPSEENAGLHMAARKFKTKYYLRYLDLGNPDPRIIRTVLAQV